MYRLNPELEKADLELRLFVQYCRWLPQYWENWNYISSELNEADIRSCSVINVGTHRNNKTNRVVDLIDMEEKAQKDYYNCLDFIVPIRDVLVTLDPKEVDLLYLRYERDKTFRELGDIYHYSAMQMQRKIDKILEKFE